MISKTCFILQVCIILISFSLKNNNASAKETPQPAALLQPRDFNPHPYENGRRSAPPAIHKLPNKNLFNQGPVRFPNSNDVDTLRKLPHPYAKVSEKSQGVAHIRPVYENIDRNYNHLEQPHYNDDEESDASSTKKHYAFSYTVRDRSSGDDFSHTQQQIDGAVHGSYKVQLPDGRLQIVKYKADDNGYRADVSYNLNHVNQDEEHNQHQDHHHHQQYQQDQHYQQHHHHHHEPDHYQSNEQHHYNQHQEHSHPLDIETPPPIPTQPTPIQYHDQNTINVSPSPALASAQPIYDYYKNLHLTGKPLSSDNHPYEYVHTTPTPYVLSSTYSPNSYHEVAAEHVDVNSYGEPPEPQPQTQTQNVQHSHYSNLNHQQHHHHHVSSTTVPFFSNPRPALIAKIVPIPSQHPSFEEVSALHESPKFIISPAEYIPQHHQSIKTGNIFDDSDSPVKHNLLYDDYGSSSYSDSSHPVWNTFSVTTIAPPTASSNLAYRQNHELYRKHR